MGRAGQDLHRRSPVRIQDRGLSSLTREAKKVFGARLPMMIAQNTRCAGRQRLRKPLYTAIDAFDP